MTAANMITVLRFLLVPAVVYCLLTVQWQLAFAAGFGPVRPALIILSGLLTVASAGAYLVAWSRHMSTDGEGGPHAGQ